MKYLSYYYEGFLKIHASISSRDEAQELINKIEALNKAGIKLIGLNRELDYSLELDEETGQTAEISLQLQIISFKPMVTILLPWLRTYEFTLNSLRTRSIAGADTEIITQFNILSEFLFKSIIDMVDEIHSEFSKEESNGEEVEEDKSNDD